MHPDLLHSGTDADTAALVEAATAALRQWTLPRGKSNGAAPAAAPAIDAQRLRAAAEKLCDEGRFRQALPLAIQLLACPVIEARDAFLAASCMQRLDQPRLALGLFALTTLLEGEEPGPAGLFRSGECLAAIGHRREAITAFDTAIDLARADPAYAEIQALAQAKCEALVAAH